MAYLEIKLRSDLCAGNGESVGNSVDTDVCMDSAGLPYIPSRRLKGCLKQSAYDLQKMGYQKAEQKNIDRLFGDAFGKEGCLFIQDAVIRSAGSVREFLKKGIPEDQRGKEAESPYGTPIPAIVKKAAHPSNVEHLFTTVRGQTRLEDGAKVDNTLRFTRVIGHYDPFELEEEKEMVFYAPVYMDTDDQELLNLLDVCCKATRHIGTGRNRGLGNVEITVCEGPVSEDSVCESVKQDKETLVEKKAVIDSRDKKISADHKNKEENSITISYKIALDSPVTLPGCDELNTSIPARSVIGCLAGGYLKHGKAEDQTFQDLFLNGTVRWSALTPVINGMISDPVPMMLVKLKNGDGRMINHLTEKSDDWKKLKPKTMDGSFAAVVREKAAGDKLAYAIAEPEIHTVYHNSINRTAQDTLEDSRKTLYMQDSIDAGMIYGGTVVCPADMEEVVIRSLKESVLRFGRSRSAQYAACSLVGEPEVAENSETVIQTTAGEIVYVILKSDLAYQKNGCYTTNNGDIREALTETLGLSKEIPADCVDSCRYHTIGGYQASWQLQKPQIPVVRAGSIYCFYASGETLPARISLGGFQQEGFGVCNIMTQNELLNVTEIIKGTIDRVEPEFDTERMEKIYTKILVSAGIEIMKQYALDFEVTRKDIPLARLRRMLSEARSYKDLLDMVGTIKESDVSSEKEESRRACSEELLRKLYEEEVPSGNYSPQSEGAITKSAGNQISLRKLLSSEEGLWEEVERYPEAGKILIDHWKIPLEMILHTQHYKKER